MRPPLLPFLLLAAINAQAGTLTQCRLKAADSDGVGACVQAEKVRAANRLREAGLTAQASVRQQVQQGSRTSLTRAYQRMQAHHVRERTAVCRKQAGALEKAACEVDMDTAQIARLARLYQQ